MLDAVFKASQQRQGDSLAPRSTDQEAEELEGVEDTWDLGIDRNRKIERSRGKQKEMTRTQRYAEHEKAEYIYIYKRYKVVRMCSLAAESSEPMTSLVDQSYTFYLRPFLRHPQRCMVWKQGNSLYNQRYQTGIPSGAE